MLASGFIFGAEVAGELITFIVSVTLVVLGAGMGLMSWTLLTVVRLTQMVGVLEERVRGLVADIEHIRAGHPEIRQ